MPGAMVYETGVAARCLRLRSTLQAYLDGEADPARAEAMSAHVEECRRCGLEAKAFAASLAQVLPAQDG